MPDNPMTLVERLRTWPRHDRALPAKTLIAEAAAEIERLQSDYTFMESQYRALLDKYEEQDKALAKSATIERATSDAPTDPIYERYAAALSALEAANARNAELVAALREYGCHTPECNGTIASDDVPCDCGFAKVVSRTPGQALERVQRERAVIDAARDLYGSLAHGFVVCSNCGDQDTTSDMDFVDTLGSALSALDKSTEPSDAR